MAEGVGSPVAPAELTWALIMAAMRRLPQYISTSSTAPGSSRGLKAASMPPNFGIGMVLRGKTLGVWGYGKIGQLVAGYGKAFGMRVQVWGSGSRAQGVADGHEAAPAAKRCSRQRRAVAAPAPERGDARHRQARRPLAHEAHRAVRQHLARRAGRGPRRWSRRSTAAAPAWRRSTCSRASRSCRATPLLRLENAVCTPHIGYVEQDSYELYFGAAFDNVVNFIKGTPTNIVNPEALQVALAVPGRVLANGG